MDSMMKINFQWSLLETMKCLEPIGIRMTCAALQQRSRITHVLKNPNNKGVALIFLSIIHQDAVCGAVLAASSCPNLGIQLAFQEANDASKRVCERGAEPEGQSLTPAADLRAGGRTRWRSWPEITVGVIISYN